MKNDLKHVYVTLLSSDSYYYGVIMLNWSMRKVGLKYPLLVLCSDGVSQSICEKLRSQHLLVHQLKEHINVTRNLIDNNNSNWNYTFDKLYTWTLTNYEKVVFIDSDMQVIRNIDYLFEWPHMSAVRADQWNEPGLDKLNSGLMVIVPNMKEFLGMKKLWESGVLGYKHIGDQDVIRAYFSDWGKKPELTLPPGLNVFYSEVMSGVISKKDVDPVSIIHYIGKVKPWMMSPRALLRRSKGVFLGKYLISYGFYLFYRFPFLSFKFKHGNFVNNH